MFPRTVLLLVLAASLPGAGCNCGAAPPRPANQAPLVLIASPAEGSTLRAGEATLEATATDPEDGALDGAAVVWTSSVSGQLATGAAPDVTLAEGEQTLTVTATDSGGLVASASVSVTVLAADSPTVKILKPASGASVDLNQQLDFECQGTSADGEPLASADISWRSALSGALPGGAKMRAALTVSGADTLTCTATDPAAGGAQASASIPVTVSTTRTPTVQILQPARAEIWVKAGMAGPYSPAVTFRATAQDFNVAGGPGNLDGLIAWSLDPGAQALGIGPTVDHTFTANGDYTVTARVADSQGATAAASVRVHLVANLPPQCTIDRPQRDGEMIQQNVSFTLRGSCFDPETSAALPPQWATTAQPAALGTGTNLAVQLTALGPQDVTACAADPTDATLVGCTRRPVRVFVNSAPSSCAIAAPAANAVVNGAAAVALKGSAVDAEDPLTALTFRWTASVDGALATGQDTSSTRLHTVGTQVLTLTVTDPWGLSCSATVTVTVNGPPDVAITSARQGATDCLTSACAETPAIVLVGTASDPQGIAALQWKDSLAGVLGNTLSVSLSAPLAGRHGVLLFATDPAGAAGVALAEFTVLAAGKTQLVDTLFGGTAVEALAVGPSAGDLCYVNGTSSRLYRANDPAGAVPGSNLPAPGLAVFVLPGATPVTFAGTQGSGVTRCAGAVCTDFQGGPTAPGGDEVTAIAASASSDLLLLGTADGLAIARASDPGNGGGVLVGKRVLAGARVFAVQLSLLSTATQVKAWVGTDQGVAELDLAIASPFDPAAAPAAIVWHDVPEVRDADVPALAQSPEGRVFAGTQRGFSEVGFAAAGPDLRAAPYNYPSEWVQALLFERRVLGGVPHDLLWAGTRNGLIRYDLEVGIASRLTTADGLPSNDVRSLALGAGGVKYLGTAQGLGRYAGD